MTILDRDIIVCMFLLGIFLHNIAWDRPAQLVLGLPALNRYGANLFIERGADGRS